MFLPEEIITHINLDSITEVHMGESKSQVFRLFGKLGQHYYLKTTDSVYVNKEIENEIKILDWLCEKRIPAPTVVALARNENYTYFLMTAVQG